MAGYRFLPLLLALAASIASGAVLAQHGGHGQHRPPGAVPVGEDTRIGVVFPDGLRDHTLANMRDHLAALQEIQDLLARERYATAGQVAEDRLGMSSLKTHGAHEVAKFMPEGMQAAGTAMHRAASRFAIEAQNAGATGDLKPALSALANVTAQCVGCHAGYRFR